MTPADVLVLREAVSIALLMLAAALAGRRR
jgi:hypothetical protein